jgi:hypothetical protein
MKKLLDEVKWLKSTEDERIVQDLLTSAPSIADLEAALKIQKKRLKDILSKDLLEWMNEQDMTSLETEDFKVAIKTYVSATMNDPIKGFNWVIENGYGDLIKTTVAFPRGEFTEEIESAIEEMGASFTCKDGIAPQSLKKIVSDRLEAGESLPDEDQGIKVSYYDECRVSEK